MKKMAYVLFSGLVLASSVTMASVHLRNTDGESHDISIKCPSNNAQSSISASSVQDLGTGPCTVTVSSTGSSASAGDGGTLVITGGQISN